MDSISQRIEGNRIKNFILRIDFQTPVKAHFQKLINLCAPRYERVEHRYGTNIAVHNAGEKGDVKTTQTQTVDFVLISDKLSKSLTFSEAQNAVFFETSKYVSKKDYEEDLRVFVDACGATMGKEIFARRIGMRFINEFPCKRVADIARVFERDYSSVVKHLLGDENSTRVIALVEKDVNGQKLRIQSGIPNRFYPEKLRVYDLLLDIDSYVEVGVGLDDWVSTIDRLNHGAYTEFVKAIRNEYIEEMKNVR